MVCDGIILPSYVAGGDLGWKSSPECSPHLFTCRPFPEHPCSVPNVSNYSILGWSGFGSIQLPNGFCSVAAQPLHSPRTVMAAHRGRTATRRGVAPRRAATLLAGAALVVALRSRAFAVAECGASAQNECEGGNGMDVVCGWQTERYILRGHIITTYLRLVMSNDLYF